MSLDWSQTDRFGLPKLNVRHSYTARDEAAASTLIRAAKEVLRAAGARLTWIYQIDTFSHALGTVRMGPEASTSPHDRDGRYRGLDNLFIVAGSALPRSGGLNPSLTIAANALRIGAGIARTTPAIRGRELRTLASDSTPPPVSSP